VKYRVTEKSHNPLLTRFLFGWCSFGLSCHVDRLVEASVSKKCAVSIFRGWSGELRCRGTIYTGLQERKSEGKGQLGLPSDSPSCKPTYMVPVSPSSSLQPWKWRQHASPNC
jgi:hypothetical protein